MSGAYSEWAAYKAARDALAAAAPEEWGAYMNALKAAAPDAKAKAKAALWGAAPAEYEAWRAALNAWEDARLRTAGGDNGGV